MKPSDLALSFFLLSSFLDNPFLPISLFDDFSHIPIVTNFAGQNGFNDHKAAV
jgi:hypothetical protein